MSILHRLFPRERTQVASQPPGEVCPWVGNASLTPLDDVTLALPAALLDDGDQIRPVILGDDEMEFAAPPGELIYLRLRRGMSVELTKSCQAYVVADGPQD